MQDDGFGLLRIPLPRTRVHRSNKRSQPAQGDSAPDPQVGEHEDACRPREELLYRASRAAQRQLISLSSTSSGVGSRASP